MEVRNTLTSVASPSILRTLTLKCQIDYVFELLIAFRFVPWIESLESVESFPILKESALSVLGIHP